MNGVRIKEGLGEKILFADRQEGKMMNLTSYDQCQVIFSSMQTLKEEDDKNSSIEAYHRINTCHVDECHQCADLANHNLVPQH